MTEEERRFLCVTCLVPEITRTVHRRGFLHRSKTEALRTALAASTDVAAAVAVIRRLRPALLREPRQTSSKASDDAIIDMFDDV